MSLLLAKSTQAATFPQTIIPAEPRRITYQGVYRSSFYPTGSRFAFWRPVEVIPEGPVSGSAALSFGTGTVSLTGEGALTASIPLTLGQTGALVGTGALIGSAALLFDGSAGASVTAQIVGSAGLVFDASGTPTPPVGAETGGAKDDEGRADPYITRRDRTRWVRGARVRIREPEPGAVPASLPPPGTAPAPVSQGTPAPIYTAADGVALAAVIAAERNAARVAELEAQAIAAAEAARMAAEEEDELALAIVLALEA